MLEVCEVTKKYAANEGVFDCSLQIKRSEIISFIGPNGSGKTTFLQLMAGIINPDFGIVKIDDIDVRNQESKRDIGYMFSLNKLYQNQTVEEILEVINEIKFQNSKWDEITDLLIEFELISQKKKKLHQLSLGMQKKIRDSNQLSRLSKIDFIG